MTQTYYGNNGESLSVNTTGNQFLQKITLGLWDKVGIPRPLSKDDSLLISRILRNYISLQKTTAENNDQKENNHFWKTLGFRQDDPEDIQWTMETAEFFERSGGLMTEEDYLAKYADAELQLIR